MNNPVNKYNLDILIQGEFVDLCIPNEDFATNSTWFKWFNSLKTTRFLEQGIFFNTVHDQIDFYRSMKSQNRLGLIISDKSHYVGTISLSSINLIKRIADIALLFGEDSESENKDLLALESMALMTNHAFEVMGLKRISAGQHIKLKKWQQKLELIGYRLEGIKKMGFIKGSEEADSVSISITINDFKKIISVRERIWDSGEKMRIRLNKMPKTPFVDKLRDFIDSEGEKYYNTIFNL